MKLTTNLNVPPKTGTASDNRPEQNVGAQQHGFDSGEEFSKVFESLGNSSNQAQTKTKDKESTSTRETEKNASANRLQDDKKTQNNNSSGEKDSDSNTKSDDNAVAAANAYAMTDNRISAPVEVNSVPPARSILHIADLERIVSSLRVQNVEGGQEVTITLKNSVFEGLKVRLTTDSDQRVRAEFIAASEKVKEIIDARGGELSEILKRRGVKLSELQTSVGADTSGRGNSNEQNSAFFGGRKENSRHVENVRNKLTEQISELNENESGASYRA